MNSQPSRLSIILSIISKDFKEFLREKVYVLLSIIGLIFYVGIFWALPGDVDETMVIGIHQTGMKQMIEQFQQGEEGLKIVEFKSAKELREAVGSEGEKNEEIKVGIAFPNDFIQKISDGKKPKVTLYFDETVPKEIRTAASALVRELSFEIAGKGLPVKQPEEEEIILGRDMAGNQVPLRDKMRPLFAFFVLMVESLALASLITSEIQSKTVNAILATPAKISDVLAAKTIYGTILAFSQAILLLVALKTFEHGFLLLVLAVLLGSLMAAAVGMIVGSLAKDFMESLFWGVLFFIPFTIPAFSALFPGAASGWVKIIPSYGLAEAIIRNVSYGEGWSSVSSFIGLTAVWDVVLVSISLFFLKRKVETL